MHNYAECYATLGVTPDTDWKTLRARYRRLIWQWHPDRFLADADRKEIAEEHCKQITLAYQALEKYRREHGVLPLTAPETAAVPGTRTQGPDLGTSPDYAGTDSRAGSTVEQAGGKADTNRRPKYRRRTAIAIAVLVAVSWLVDRDFDVAPPRSDPPAAPDSGASAQSPPRQSPGGSGGISVGSTLGEVYSIQGVPTLTKDDTWYYGKSQVRFERGKVVSWKDHPDNRLRLAANQPVFVSDRHFDVGSTKDEVRELQGPPMSETDSVWGYGPSRVFFEHDR